MDSSNPAPQTVSKKMLRPGPHIMLAMGFATIIGLLVASYVNINIGENSIYPTHAYNVRINNLDQLKEHLIDADTAVHGFVATRDESFLAPYTRSLPALDEDLKKIRKSYSEYQPNERALIDQLDTLVHKHVAHLGRILQATRQNNLQEAGHLIQTGQPVMEQFRKLHNGLRNLLVGHYERAMAKSMRGLNLMEGVVYFLSISTITLLIVWFAATQRQQRLRNQFDQILLERNFALEMQVQSRTEELVALAGYLSNARETEKANLARELHDELGALLTAAKHDASWVERKLPTELDPAIRERITRLQQNLSSVIGLKRNLINNLRPAMLHDLGLLTALRNLAEEFSNSTDITVKVKLPDNEINVPEPMALAIFRIVQEAFTNSRKYAQASEVQLELFEEGETLVLNLYDNGVGFDLTSPAIARHGLAGMKHRVQMLKGKIEIASNPGKGVLITVEIPLRGAGAHQNRVIADRRQSGLPRI